MMYLKSALQLTEYGHEGFSAHDGKDADIEIGACFIGMFVKHSNGQPTIYFKWPDIYNMKVKDKTFAIETATERIMFKMVSLFLIWSTLSSSHDPFFRLTEIWPNMY